MQITRNTTETAAGPSEWFTGAVYVDAVAAPSSPSRLKGQRCSKGNRPRRDPATRPPGTRTRGSWPGSCGTDGGTCRSPLAASTR
jgi:hypothetical protein